MITTKGLSERDKAIIQARVEGQSQPQIARTHGISHAMVFKILKRVNPIVKECLREMGYGVREGLQKMVEMTEAQDTKFFAHKGVVRTEKMVADNATRLRSREIMLNVLGIKTTSERHDEPVEPGFGSLKIALSLSVSEIKELRAAGIALEVSGDREPMEQPVLDAELDQHSGPAGSGAPVQALPKGKGLPPGAARTPRKRKRLIRRKKPNDDDQLVGRG